LTCACVRMAATIQWLVLGGRAARSFAVGALAVAVPIAIADDELSTTDLINVLTAGLAGATLQIQLVPWISGKLGRFRTLAASAVAMAIASIIFAISRSSNVLVAVSLVFAFSLQPNISVSAPLEQSTLADATVASERTMLFARYNGISTLAISCGSIAMAIPVPGGAHSQCAFAGLVLLSTALAYIWFGQQNQSSADSKAPLLKNEDLPLSECRHYTRILSLAGLFFVDSFAGGMTMNSFLVHWMFRQYDMDESTLGMLFAVSGVIIIPSLWVAAWLGEKIGLVNTMVYTHLPANVGLILMPFMPGTKSLIGVVIFRACLSQMDVPARDSFMMTVVDDDERVACASFIGTIRGVACMAGPPVAAFLWVHCGAGTPLIVAGILKCAYDIALFCTFRDVYSAKAAPTRPSEVFRPSVAEGIKHAEPARGRLSSAAAQPLFVPPRIAVVGENPAAQPLPAFPSLPKDHLPPTGSRRMSQGGTGDDVVFRAPESGR